MDETRTPDDAELARRRRALKDRVTAQPQRLDLRAELAAVYRAEGNAAQAGRWGHLSPDVRPDETAAFVRAFGDDPVEIMRVLRWQGSEQDASTPLARERLRAVRKRAEASLGRTTTWEDPGGTPPGRWEGVLVLLGVLAFLTVVVVGVGTIGAWLWRLLGI
ncbi:DUF6584 family protein [Cellulomonas wangsupingiae]|uniref:DUF1707 domain-containing protein n=1 Tax=Cellulomonas wangsupingiae TaxID=2968085 RepID=A0ABY5K717_9CELL|nr:DUF6584 family protein [Cellulomonas wangsupingiae]MCC2336006.1 hypothetical protein [Cellulomonas wangsupingiae]UUI64731.1 hypothetical protein NP075_16700 [Cellulomonas wangsupingiae]